MADERERAAVAASDGVVEGTELRGPATVIAPLESETAAAAAPAAAPQPGTASAGGDGCATTPNVGAAGDDGGGVDISAAPAELRFEHRRRYLHALIALSGREVALTLGDGSAGPARAVYRSWSADGAQAHVSDLATPLGVVREALVRGTDIARAEFAVPVAAADTDADSE